MRAITANASFLRIILAMFGFAWFFAGCNQDESDDGSPPEIRAGFSYVVADTNKQTLYFSNASSNAETYLWRFGDGDTSSAADPVHTYAEPGTYTVTLTAYNDDASADTTAAIEIESAAPQGPPLRLGAVFPLTGGLENYAFAAREGAELAVAQVNAAGGINGRPVQLVVQDSRLDPEIAEAAARRLLEDSCIAIIGELASSITQRIAENVSIPNSVPQISSVSSATALTSLNDNNMLWRTCLSDLYNGNALARHAMQALGAENAAVLRIENSFGEGVAARFVQAFQAEGGVVEQPITYPDRGSDYTDYDFSGHVEALFAERPPVVAIIGYAPDGSRILQEIAEWKVENDPDYAPVILTTDAWHTSLITENVSYDLVQTIVGASLDASADPESAFYRDFTAATGRAAPGPFAANAYDAALTAMLAAAAAGATDGPSIAAELPGISTSGEVFSYERLAELLAAIRAGRDVDFSGASGPVDFDANGDVRRGRATIWRFANNNGEIDTQTTAVIEVGD